MLPAQYVIYKNHWKSQAILQDKYLCYSQLSYQQTEQIRK